MHRRRQWVLRGMAVGLQHRWWGLLSVALQRAVELVDAQSGPVSRRPSWYAEAHRLLGDCALGERRNADAIRAYQSYLEAAPPGAVDRDEVTAKLLRLGVEPNVLL